MAPSRVLVLFTFTGAALLAACGGGGSVTPSRRGLNANARPERRDPDAGADVNQYRDPDPDPGRQLGLHRWNANQVVHLFGRNVQHDRGQRLYGHGDVRQ